MSSRLKQQQHQAAAASPVATPEVSKKTKVVKLGKKAAAPAGTLERIEAVALKKARRASKKTRTEKRNEKLFRLLLSYINGKVSTPTIKLATYTRHFRKHLAAAVAASGTGLSKNLTCNSEAIKMALFQQEKMIVGIATTAAKLLENGHRDQCGVDTLRSAVELDQHARKRGPVGLRWVYEEEARREAARANARRKADEKTA